MQFITKYAINVRSGPNTTYSDIGDLPAGYVLTALEIQPMDNNSVWIRFDAGKWVALVHNGGGPYLNFHAAVPCPEGEPMTPEQLQRLEAVEAKTAEHENEITALQNTSPGEVFIATHKLVTTKTGGEKLRAYPNGSEAVQVYNGAILMELKQERGGQVLMGYEKEGVIITGFIDPLLLVEL